MGIDSATLELSAQRLFPNQDLDQVLVELLLERAQKNLVKYRTMARQFKAKYGQDFETFRQTVLDSEPTFEVEQDYFDWEMATTGIVDMQEEIEQLQHLKRQS
jgi:translation initiation factor 2 alpha subunit (eIF-2alpha)